MKKLQVLIVVFAVATISSAATISLIGPTGHDQFIVPSNSYLIKVVSDVAVLSIDAVITVDGMVSVAAATGLAQGVQYFGWDSTFAAETIVAPKSVTIAAGNFNGIGGAGKVIAELFVHLDGHSGLNPIIIAIRGNDQLGGSINMDGTSFASFGPPVVIRIPEPISLSLLGLGGLFLARRRA